MAINFNTVFSQKYMKIVGQVGRESPDVPKVISREMIHIFFHIQSIFITSKILVVNYLLLNYTVCGMLNNYFDAKKE